MTAKELYVYAIDQATAVVVQVEPEQLGLATPDTEWTVRDLLQHMLYELAWTADIVAGKTIPEVGERYETDLVGGDPIENWRRYALRVQEVVETCSDTGVAHLSYGTVPVREYLWEAGNDQLVHAWDLGQAIGVSVVFDEVVAQVLYNRAVVMQDQIAASELFAPPVSVSATANLQTKLLAAFGRSEDWVEVKKPQGGGLA